MDQIAQAGAEIFGYVRVAGYWVCLIAGGSHAITCIVRKDAQAALRTAFTYGSAFCSIVLLKWVLDFVQRVFVV